MSGMPPTRYLLSMNGIQQPPVFTLLSKGLLLLSFVCSWRLGVF